MPLSDCFWFGALFGGAVSFLAYLTGSPVSSYPRELRWQLAAGFLLVTLASIMVFGVVGVFLCWTWGRVNG